MTLFAKLAAAGLPLLSGVALAAGLAIGGTALAQTAEPAPVAAAAPQRCTGLFCDAYYGMNPNAQPGSTSLPCHDFVCGAFGGRTADAAPAVQQAAAAPEADVAKPTAHKKKHLARKAKPDAKMTSASAPQAPQAELAQPAAK